MKALLLCLAVCVTSGCAYVIKPKTELFYDAECEIQFKKMTLTAEQISLIGGCTSEYSCRTRIIAAYLMLPLSAVVSGSVVVVGNTVYWLQKTGRCMVNEGPGGRDA
ncbi:hypothetical protein [Solimonas variicoloris]|uniref:hypothetical protein n=1 Tax=Solimonas variicoloris TaxID=254408 RepID=UPI00035EBC3E|nr:hypothetical protein [Solimonas variicoloris]